MDGHGRMDAHEQPCDGPSKPKGTSSRRVEVSKGKVVNKGDYGGALSYSGGLVVAAWSPTPGRRRVARN